VPTHREVYASHAEQYEALIAREDHEGNILRAIRDLVSLGEVDLVDLGTGTGRLARWVAPHVRSLLAFDVSLSMLEVARRELLAVTNARRWLAAAADHRRLPLGHKVADVLVSGWSVSYLATWNPGTWRQELAKWRLEAERVLRPGGRILLLESLGTGNENPERLPHLEGFYEWLDQEGFAMTWIRTDYRFESEQIADQLTGFFFGEEVRTRIQRGDLVTLPECTGVWWKSI
jgi:ubiquinone/menaquinone biosynthesis C-methylase UbiE